MFTPGNYVKSTDERDDPQEVFIVVETEIEHRSGPTSKIRPTGTNGPEDLFRLDSRLRRVSINAAALRLGNLY